MDDRRYQPTHDRLYAAGKEKIRTKNLQAVKEKALLKLEKDKASKKAFEIQQAIKSHEE